MPQQLFAGAASGGSGGASGAGPLTSGLIGRPSTTQSLLMRYTTAANARGAAGKSQDRSSQAAGSAGSLSSSQSNASREAAIGALLNSSIASLRATLHTDKVSSAVRPKVQPQDVISQSSDFVEAGWRSPITASGAAGGGALGGGSGSSSSTRPSSGVARGLAPNGQPRKMPVAALAAMMPPPAAATSASGKAGMLQGPTTPATTGQVGRLSAYYNSNK